MFLLLLRCFSDLGKDHIDVMTSVPLQNSQSETLTLNQIKPVVHLSKSHWESVMSKLQDLSHDFHTAKRLCSDHPLSEQCCLSGNAQAAPKEQLIVQNFTLFSQNEKQIKSKNTFL